MHPNPAFRTASRETNLAFARARAFGVLCVNGEDGPLLAHAPFRLAEDGATVDLHLVRSNPIMRRLVAPQPAIIAVSGPDGYVSPDWYGMPDQVPTWNYVAVHLRGVLEARGAGELRPMLDALTAGFEERLRPKRPWTADKMGEGVMARMMRMIAPCRLRLTAVDGTWKLNQNKPDAVRLAAARELADAGGAGQERAALAAMMRAAAPA
jgi:transcriptional regulator